MSSEIWKDISGYEGRYMISNFGRVKSLPKYNVSYDRILKPSITGAGYEHICLYKDGKSFSHDVHRLVAYEHVTGYGRGYVVNHIDGNKCNNYASNLEWCTQSENIRRGRCHPNWSHILSDDDIRDIVSIGFTLPHSHIAALYGVSPQHICNIVHNASYTEI